VNDIVAREALRKKENQAGWGKDYSKRAMRTKRGT